MKTFLGCLLSVYKCYEYVAELRRTVFANKIRKYANNCFPGETPAIGDLRPLVATHTCI